MTNANNIPEPFGSDYQKNQAKHDTDGCALCGREIKSDNGIPSAQIIDGGSSFGPADYYDSPEFDETSYMGCYPVGPTCARKYRAHFTSLGYSIR